MKKIALGLMALLLATSSHSHADDRSQPSNKEGCKPQVECTQGSSPREHMVALLELRDDQLEEVMDILEQSRHQRRTLHSSSREQHEALFQQTLDQLQPLLDEVQMKRFIEFAEQRRAAGKPKKGPRDERGRE